MHNLSYDLHLHSCLSPCGDTDMTPGNIAGMAAVKELDVIALTDHNTCKNCPPFLKQANDFGILAIPGMELCTREEVHVLCLFEELEAAMEFDKYVYSHLFKVKNKAEIFGEQLLVNEEDEVYGEEEYLLLNAADIGFDEVYDLVKGYNGIMIPAHIDKSANSLIANLGFIPPDSRFTCVEVKEEGRTKELKEKHPYLNQCRIIYDSDAHYLEHINEPVHFLQAAERNRREVLKALITP
ncbi:PHP domain-containing protein [Anaerocolumna xylanovorans]|nr:PHP domain-containing protein [Anaerocolumna xylanovorans]